jgi:hypothetical protein
MHGTYISILKTRSHYTRITQKVPKNAQLKNLQWCNYIEEIHPREIIISTSSPEEKTQRHRIYRWLCGGNCCDTVDVKTGHGLQNSSPHHSTVVGIRGTIARYQLSFLSYSTTLSISESIQRQWQTSDHRVPVRWCWRGKNEVLEEKPVPVTATLSTTCFRSTCLELNSGLRIQTPTTNRLNHATASSAFISRLLLLYVIIKHPLFTHWTLYCDYSYISLHRLSPFFLMVVSVSLLCRDSNIYK